MVRPAKPLDERRAGRLLVVAAEAFVSDGYEGASLNRIIADAGWSKSSFYHYFRDKQDLYEHMLETLRAQLAAQTSGLDVDALTRDTFWPRLDASLRGMGAAPVTDLQRLALARLLHAGGALEPGLGQVRAELLTGLGAALRRGQELGAVRADLPGDLVVELAASWLFALDRWAAEQPPSGPAGGTAAAAGRGLQILYQALART